MSLPPATIYLLDDEPGMVKAIRRLLILEGYHVRGFTSAAEFIESYEPGGQNCLVLDVAMPEINGIRLQESLKHDGLLVPIIFLTGHGDIPTSVLAMRAGAVDFLTKPVKAPDLLHAISRALQKSAEQRDDADFAIRVSKLTPRERQVFERVVKGDLNKQIAGELGTGEQNIKIHRGRMMQKLEVESLAELVRMAERMGPSPQES